MDGVWLERLVAGNHSSALPVMRGHIARRGNSMIDNSDTVVISSGSLRRIAALAPLATLLARARYRQSILLYRQARLIASSDAISGVGRLSIGKRWDGQVGKPTEVVVRRGGQLQVEGNFVLHRGGSIRIGSRGRLTLGSGYIADDFHVECLTAVNIGHDVAIARCVTIMDTDHHALTGARTREGPVQIGNHVWIGANATILKNVTIGDGAVVAAGSIVTRDVAAGALVAGVPARFIRNVEWYI